MGDGLTTAQRIEHAIRTYVKALNDAYAEGISACFCKDAVHYFPAAPKISGATALGVHYASLVREREICWTVDQMLVDVNRCEAALEWTRFDHNGPRYLRGVDWFVFERETLQIREIRSYWAAASNPDAARQELQDFNYPKRGYPI
jgi:methyltransferase